MIVLKLFSTLYELVVQHLPEFGRQVNVGQAVGAGKEWSDIMIIISGYAAAYAGYKECEFGVLVSKPDEFFNLAGYFL